MADAAKISVTLEAVTGEAHAALAQFSANIGEFARQATQQMGEMQRSLSLSTISHAFGPAMDALAGPKRQVTECVGAAVNWEGEVKGLARTLGTSTAEAGGLANALKRLGSDTGAYTDAVFSLQRSLMAQEAAFNANGIATRGAGGEMLGIQQVMADTLKRIREMKPGYDANALSMLAFGRGAKDLGGILKLTGAAIDEGAAKVRALGIEVGAGDTAAQAYKAAMADVNDTMEALKIKVGQDVMPAMAELAKAFANMAAAAAPMVKAAIQGVAALFSNLHVAAGLLAVVLAHKVVPAIRALATETIPRLKLAIIELKAAFGAWMIAIDAAIVGVTALVGWLGKEERASKAAAAHAGAGGQLRQYAAQLREVIGLMGKEGGDKAALAEHKRVLIDAMDALGGVSAGFKRIMAGYDTEGKTEIEIRQIEHLLSRHKARTAAELAAAEAAMAASEAGSEQYASWSKAVAECRQELIAITGEAAKASAAFVAPSADPGKPEKPAGPPELTNPMPALPDTAANLKALKDMEAMEAAAEAKRRDLGLLALERERGEADHRVRMGEMTAERRLEIERAFIDRENQLRRIGAEDAQMADAEALNQTLANLRETTEAQTARWCASWSELGESIKQSVGDAFKGLVIPSRIN